MDTFQIISAGILRILKAGWYSVDISMSTNRAGSNFIILMTSNNSVGDFVNYHISTETSASI